MMTLELKRATTPLAQYAGRVSRNPLVLTAKGKPVAALFAIANADRETVTLCTRPQFLALIEGSRKRQKREGGIGTGEMRRRLELTQARRRKSS